MAKVEALQRSKRNTFKLQPTSVTCYYAVFDSGAGKKMLQLDTFGSSVREKPGKQSQTLQFGQVEAKALWTLLGKEFGF